MDVRKYAPGDYVPSHSLKTSNMSNKFQENHIFDGRERVPGRSVVVADKVPELPHFEGRERVTSRSVTADVDIDLREVYFLIMHFLSVGPCQKTSAQFLNELMEHQLLPRRYHAWYSRTNFHSGDEDDDGVSLPLTYENILHRYPHIAKDHLVRLLKQLMLRSPSPSLGMGYGPNAADVPTLLGTGSFSLLSGDYNAEKKQLMPRYLRWPHKQVDQVHALHLRAIGGGFTKHHRASSIHAACYAVAKPSTMVQKMQNIKRIRGHRNAVYCAIFDRAGRHVITGSDDRLVKIWSMETAFCLASCRGHEGDITDLAVSSNNALVASASNDFVIRVWRLPDGLPISVLQGHTGAVTAIAFSPRTAYQLLSSSDDGTCRIWDARNSQFKPRIYVPKPSDIGAGTSQQNHQILCCGYNASGTVFVTGSSDTFARVWIASKFCADEPEQPFNEIDLLAGHENDVNYVQFSGCAIIARSVTSDALKDDQSLKFKNLWFNHDNIVTCSRDGSAIIWVPRSRKSHGKVGRWTKAYHLKVPPPPLPPQPPRGGPRRRILPTPRGVNMIVWSLDNRFVLAAIMDCRICVWNAADGSLVHCLTGHTESTYVLDVHPFNPRIAMSAGYDGKTIIWDIWEGIPVRVFEIGRGKLVDGKFSSDGTSIVLSDDIGQIYLLNTGQGESHKDAKYDQFFLGDYRPLIRDTMGNVVDQESQSNPYQRNLLDLLCDSSMIPYPEPYQSMYQRRRLGALGVEWRPSNIKFAVCPDFSLGEDYPMAPLPDPEAIIDIPELLDATLWEPENEAVMSDDADSEYDVGEEYSSVKEQESLGTSSTSDTDSDAENFDFKQKQKDGLRRSKRKNERTEVEWNASGRRIRRKRVEDCTGTSSQNIKGKKVKSGRKSSKKKPSEAKLFRPQRTAARNASSTFSRISESEEEEEEDSLEDDSSESESFSQVSDIRDDDLYWGPQNMLSEGGEKPPVDESPGVMDPIEPLESQTAAGNKKKLVLKLCVRDSRKTMPKSDSKKDLESSSSLPQTSENGCASLNDEDMDLHPPVSTDQTPTQNGNKFTFRCKGQLESIPNHVGSSVIVDDVYSLDKISADSDIPIEESRNGNFDRPEDVDISSKMSHQLKENAHPVATKIKIKSSGILKQEKTPKLKLISGMKKPVDMDENNSNTGYHESFLGADFPDAETNVVRRTRSMEMKASTCESGRRNHKVKSLNNDRSAGTSKIPERSSRDYMPNSTVRSRSTRSKQDNFYEDDLGPPSTSLSNVGGGKIPWLMLSEHEPGYRYIPQLGDEVVYLGQGHQEYIESYALSDRGCPWTSMKGRIKDVELCMVEALDYVTVPGSGESACKLTLKFIDESSSVCGRSFKLTLPELLQAPDFLVEKSWYGFAVNRSWAPGDMCTVWWRHEVEEGGSWWEGRIISIKAKSSNYPDSPWERYAVQYQGDPSPQLHSPWELHEPEVRWDPPHLDFETRNKLLDYLSKLERRKLDSGLVNLEQASQKPDFWNRFPVPLSPSVIRSRLTNNYYRSIKAVKHDIDVMMTNAMSYFPKNGELYRKMRRMAEHFERTFSTL